MFRLIAVAALTLSLVGCTENQMVKNWGGTMTIDLTCGEKLFDLTWKGEDFWYATRPMREGEFPETYSFTGKQDGMKLGGNGTVRVVECAK